jgi:AraC family transcriptional regulator
MRLTVEGFALQSARIRRVLDYLGTHLDDDVPLSRLADLACLSPSQLERLYVSKLKETPMATLRRLRLKRAHEQIRQDGSSLMDAAFGASYASHAAFTRAFVRQFGYAPSRLPLFAAPQEAPPKLRLEFLDTREVFQIPYSGIYHEHHREVGHLVGNMAVGGAKRWRKWSMLDRDNPLSPSATTRVEMTHFIPATNQPDSIRNVDRVIQPAGLYAVHEDLSMRQPRQLCALAEKIRVELGCRIVEGAFGGSHHAARNQRRWLHAATGASHCALHSRHPSGQDQQNADRDQDLKCVTRTLAWHLDVHAIHIRRI